MGDHQSSWFERAQTRALVTAEQRLGLEPKRAKAVFLILALVILLVAGYASMSASTGDGASDGTLSNALVDDSAAASSASSNLFADDGDEEESGDEGKVNDSGDEEESDEGDHASSSKADTADDDDSDSEALKPKQLKLYQDRDKTLMKFFTKHRKDSEVAAHFQSLEDTYKELKLIRTISIGSTSEKKAILAYVIGKGKSGRGILVHATERGDEWTGNMGLAYFATRLLQKYALTPAVTKVVNQLTIYLVPVVNPDGLAYCISSSSKSHREWYMNRALNSDKKHGVDVSKDFESFSQLESQALRDFAQKNAQNIHAFVNVRCCRGSVSTPKTAMCSSQDEQMRIMDRVAGAMGKLGSFKYATHVADQMQGTSAAWAASTLGLGLSMVLDAHTASTVSMPADVKSGDILTASQNVTMGLMEIAKYVAVDMPRAKVGLGGGGSKPCGSQAASRKGAVAADDGDDDGESRDDAGDEEGDHSDTGGDDEGSSDGKDKSAEAEDDGRDHAQSFDQARQGGMVESTDELEMSLKYSQPEGINHPVPNVDIPSDTEGGDTFLYFAYGPDMLYDVLLKAGLTSAWKVVNARLTGYTYDYTYHSNKKWRSGVADIVKHTHGTVYGVVWRLDRLHLQTLLTWQSASTPTSPLAKKLVTVQDNEGTSYACLTFYVVKKMKGEDILGKYHRFNPSRQYRNCVLKGAKANHLPSDYVEHKLRSRSLGPLFTDKVGTTGHRNALIGTVCDPTD